MIELTQEGVDRIHALIETEFRARFFKQATPLADKIMAEVCAEIMTRLKINIEKNKIKIVLEVR